MQVRFGEHIRLEAYRAGLAAGPAYRLWQDAFRLETADTQVRERVEALGMTITPALELSWPLSSLKTYASVAFVVEAGYLTGAIASLLRLSNGRMEDELLLRDLGLAQARWVGFGLDTSRRMVKAHRRGESRLTLGFIGPPVCWGALVLFLPRPLGLFALFHQLAQLVTAVVGAMRDSES